MVDKFKQADKILVFIETGVGILAFSAIVLFSLANLLIRNFLQSEWSINLADWIGTTLPHMIIIVGLLGASIGVSRNEVIRIDFLRQYYPEKLARFLNPLLYLATSVILGIFIYTAWKTSEFDDTNWIVTVYIPLFVTFTLKCIIHIFIPIPIPDQAHVDSAQKR
ncbi:MAG: TRAP transporter small permease subunit [Leptospirales bacterium]